MHPSISSFILLTNIYLMPPIFFGMRLGAKAKDYEQGQKERLTNMVHMLKMSLFNISWAGHGGACIS